MKVEKAGLASVLLGAIREMDCTVLYP